MIKRNETDFMHSRDLIEEMNAYYDKQAPWHDECMGYSCNTKMEALLGPMIALFEEHVRDKDVLEIACGTGNWTQVLARRARSVTATDVNASVLEMARGKPLADNCVTFRVADAYTLNGVDELFDVAFAADWWSHIPRAMILPFLEVLHRRIRDDARVVFLDMMPRDVFDREEVCYDDDGNRISTRTVRDGSQFSVVKNFPDELELRSLLDQVARHVEYYEHLPLRRWLLTYTKR